MARSPEALHETLRRLVDEDVRLSAMIWGPPGIGKSSIVAAVATERELELVDLRLSQLAPTDLRGLPVPEDGVSRWYPPSFLPIDPASRGVLFLDELNLAPPALQGIAQQLILDRQVGDYRLPDGWFVWGAGNRKRDRGAVFEMPQPLANRFVHLHVEPDLESFRGYAIARGLAPELVAFLSFRPELLHAPSPDSPAWPSPRTWEMASTLIAAGVDVAAAVGEAAAEELAAFRRLTEASVDLEAVLAGEGAALALPDEPSARYATVIGLGLRARDATEGQRGFAWLSARADSEWQQLYVSHLTKGLRQKGKVGELAALVREVPAMQALLAEVREAVSDP